MDFRVESEKNFFLFGMGNRQKMIYQSGKLISYPDHAELLAFDVLSEEIDPAEYSVKIVTPNGTERIYEDEEAVKHQDCKGNVTILTALPIRLPGFDGSGYRQALRILHHEILINIIDSKPVPNFFVYRKPWYRDGAMMTMVLEKTGNINLIKKWADSISEMYDKNNKGIEESDNLGELLYILAKTENSDSPLIEKIIEEAKRRSVNGYLTGLTDYDEHPVYQTKWLKFGLEALGLPDDWLKVPDVEDSYSALFWMDGHNEGPDPNEYCADYPYLSWARAHSAGFSMDEDHMTELLQPSYPLSLEANASEAEYSRLEPYFGHLYETKCSAPHTWHAAEMFLYITDMEKTEK